VIGPLRRPLADHTQQSQQTDIHARGGIRTHNPSKPAAADTRLRPRGHWARQAHALAVPNIRVKQPFSYPSWMCSFTSLVESWFVSIRVVLVSCVTQLQFTLNSNRRFNNYYSITGRSLHKIKKSGSLVLDYTTPQYSSS